MIETVVGGLVVGGIVSSCVNKIGARRKLEKQVKFYDAFRELDNQLARNSGENFKGVTYLIKGLEVSNTNKSLIASLKNIRNYRGRLSHDRLKWANIPAPDKITMKDLRFVRLWVKRHKAYAKSLVNKGEQAFNSNHKGLSGTKKSSRVRKSSSDSYGKSKTKAYASSIGSKSKNGGQAGKRKSYSKNYNRNYNRFN